MEMTAKLSGIPTISDDKLLQKRIEIEALYKTIGSVYCPYLKEKVNFNSLGFEHLKFKGHGKPRNKFDQYVRLKLFYLSPEIIKKSNTVQGICEKKEWEKQKRHGHWEQILVDVKYHEFVAVIGKMRIKVIIKKVGNGDNYFWSIIPFWKMKTGINGPEKILNEGDPEVA